MDVHVRDIKKGDTWINDYGEARWIALADAIEEGGAIMVWVEHLPYMNMGRRSWVGNVVLNIERECEHASH